MASVATNLEPDEMRALRVLAAKTGHTSLSAYVTKLIRRELAKAEKKAA